MIAALWLLLAGDPALAGDRPLLLWRVERDGAVSHLLGTCHLPIPLEHALPRSRPLKRARVLYDEADLAGLDPLDALGLTWSTEAPLSEQLGPEAFGALSMTLRDVYPAPMVDRSRPWALWGVLSAPPPTATSEPVLDVAVTARAAAFGVEVRHLETLEQQAAMLGGFDPLFLDLLRGSRESQAQAATQLAAVQAACGPGDLGALEAMVGDPAYATVLATLLVERNRAWRAALEPELAVGGVFVAVGVAHLVGPDGLVATLAADGFQVERLVAGRSRHALDLTPAVDRSRSPDLARAAAWADQLSAPGGVVDLICAEGQLVRTCVEPDPDRCVARLRADLGLCATQWSDLLPDVTEALPADVSVRVASCAPTGVFGDALATGTFGDAPMCTALLAGLPD